MLWLGTAAVTILGALLRLRHLGQPMRFDESMTFLLSVEEGPADVMTDYAIPNNHILHNLLAGAFVAASPL